MDRRMVEYEAKKQTPLVAYILLVVFGVVGAHNFYLGRRGQALAQLLFSVVMAGAMLWLFVGFASAEMADVSGGFDAFVRRAWTFYAIAIVWGVGSFAWLVVNAIEVPKLIAEHNVRLHARIFGTD
ncbi:NINE protein [Candidatus Palauibacter irciniicola]|uniref:NINE protein n=1 Tax=Candidatus Palauibacter irciniicola TaxID=3056733 RepID=UPI003B02250C